MRSTSRVQNLETLPARMRALEKAAFDDFADHFGPLFRAMFIRRGLTPYEAEDLALSCISDIALKIKNYKKIEDKSFAAWAFRIARNSFADYWEKRLRSIAVATELHRSASLPLQKSIPRAGVVAAVQEALSRLPDRDREIIFQRNMGEQKTYDEISRDLHITAGAARVRHNRALDKLKQVLEKDHRIKEIIDRYSRRIGDGSTGSYGIEGVVL